MRKYKAIMLALFAVCAFSAVAASSASAAHQWLKNGAPIVAAQLAITDGLLLLHHTGGLGGTVTVHCDGRFHGTVGPGAVDTITEVWTLTEMIEITSAHPISCTVEVGKNLCPVGSLVTVWPDNLSVAGGLVWKTELQLTGTGPIFDDLTGPNNGPGFNVKCSGITILCATALDRSQFLSNLATGAMFDFLGELKAACNDGGTSTVTGTGEVLGFTVD
jgi:hypothetical protein